MYVKNVCMYVCFCFALLRSVIGQENSRHFFNQWEAKPKPIASNLVPRVSPLPFLSRFRGREEERPWERGWIASCTLVFSRAWRRLLAIALYSDWFIALFASLMIGQSNCFLVSGHSIDNIRILGIELDLTWSGGSCGKIHLHMKRFPRKSLHFMLGPVQYQKYEYSLLTLYSNEQNACV